MNKAFVREPEFDGRAYCPRCGALGVAVAAGPMDTHVRREARTKIGDSGWFCTFARCEVAYFDLFAGVITVDELNSPVYPKEIERPICACFGFTLEDIEADVRDGTPTRIRELLAKSQSPQARCQTLAADGQCCMREVQRLYMKLRNP
jgi:hypothetical protein